MNLKHLFAAAGRRTALLCALLGISWAAASAAVQAEDEFLPPEQAFQFTAAAEGDEVVVRWTATKGYYLYEKRMGLGSGDPAVAVGAPLFPKAEKHTDEYFGEQNVFRGSFVMQRAAHAHRGAGASFPLQVKFQGCADAGLCYRRPRAPST
jgi:thiol:disulfide interchange protein DsbD